MKKILETEKKVVSLKKQRDDFLCRHNCTVFEKIWATMLKCIAFSNNIAMNDPIKAFSEVYRLAYTIAKNSEDNNDGIIINGYTKPFLPGHRGIRLVMSDLPPIEASEPLYYFSGNCCLAELNDDGATLRSKLDRLNKKLELMIELCRRVFIVETLKSQRQEANLTNLKNKLEKQLASFKSEA